MANKLAIVAAAMLLLCVTLHGVHADDLENAGRQLAGLPCGEPGQTCCLKLKQWVCDPGAYCTQGRYIDNPNPIGRRLQGVLARCIKCGGPGEACCPRGVLLVASGVVVPAPIDVLTGRRLNGLITFPPVLTTCLPGNTCLSSKCVPACGQTDQPCCTPGNTCSSPGSTCAADGICRLCGGPGQACCAGNTCSSSLTCNGGKCIQSCGGPLQQCCAASNDADKCNTVDLICRRDVCTPCGDVNERCCLGDTCSSGLACSASKVCTPTPVPVASPPVIAPPPAACGSLGLACCSPDSSCDGDDLLCRRGKCVGCGDQGEVCCAGRTCADDLTCGAGNRCNQVACGSLRQPCCSSGRSCNAELLCGASGTCVVPPRCRATTAFPPAVIKPKPKAYVAVAEGSKSTSG